MPLYQISTREPLNPKVKADVAMMITDVHCKHTGAPRTFVNVMFVNRVPLSPATDLHVFGSVRGGRTLQTNDNVEEDMVAQLAALTGVDLRKIEFMIFPIPASHVMEGGVVLPEPGEEASWLEQHHHAAE
ncbi:MAG: tautomerase family protein [Myxococcota bacterium]